MKLQISVYQNTLQKEWDDFVLNQSINGTVFHTQKFLSYHQKNRFNDSSILVYQNKTIVAVILAAKAPKGFFSHPGTSGGGIIIRKNIDEINFIIEEVENYYECNISYFIPEDIFISNKKHEYIKAISNKKNVEKEISMYFDLKKDNPIKNKRLLTGINSCSQFRFNKTSKEEDYIQFYHILEKNLQRHNTQPVHTFEELQRLRSILDNNIFLYVATNEQKIIAGLLVIKVNNNSWHTQYIVRDYEFKNQYILAALIKQLEMYAKSENQQYLSLGSCNGGKEKKFSSSLYNFKKKLGSEECFRYHITP